jgi:hypothetical protein
MGITRQQALDCFASDDLIGLGMEADALRRRLHPEAVVGYTITRPLDLSSPLDAALAGVRKSLAMGATGLILRADVQREPHLAHYERLLSGVKRHFPGIWLHGLAATQILTLASAAGVSLRDALARLHQPFGRRPRKHLPPARNRKYNAVAIARLQILQHLGKSRERLYRNSFAARQDNLLIETLTNIAHYALRCIAPGRQRR